MLLYLTVDSPLAGAGPGPFPYRSPSPARRAVARMLRDARRDGYEVAVTVPGTAWTVDPGSGPHAEDPGRCGLWRLEAGPVDA